MSDEERLQGLCRAVTMLHRIVADPKSGARPLGRKRPAFDAGWNAAFDRLAEEGFWLDSMKKWVDEVEKEHPEWDKRFFGKG